MGWHLKMFLGVSVDQAQAYAVPIHTTAALIHTYSLSLLAKNFNNACDKGKSNNNNKKVIAIKKNME